MTAIRDEGIKIPKPNEIKEMIMKDEPEKIPEYAEKIAQFLVSGNDKEKLSKNQIRNFYTEVKQIEGSIKANKGDFSKDKRRFMLLKPRLEYHASKDKGVDKLKGFLMPAIECVKEDQSKFYFFVDFFEAILAYHQVKETENKNRNRGNRED